MKKKILAIGAYERDNFGDLLFYQVLKESLKEFDVVAGSILYSDMTSTLGEKVLPYPLLLEKYEWDAIWVAGGEVGGIDLDMAYGMSLDKPYLETYKRLSKAKKMAVQRAFSGSRIPETVYLPELKNYALNKNTPLIINSVGISNIKHMANKGLAKRSRDILRSANGLAVRESRSLEYCNRNRIHASLAPDIVHIIANLSSWQRLKKKKNRARSYITFQMSQHLLSKYKKLEVVDMLADVIESSKMKIVMIAAGTALHHDSYAEYHWLKTLLDQRLGRGSVEILHSRKPADIVEAIINSELWLGTSLHGRIIANAYNIPRISLENEKVHTYAQTWDHLFSSNVPLAEVKDVLHKTLVSGVSDEAKDLSRDITDRAFSQLRAFKETLV